MIVSRPLLKFVLELRSLLMTIRRPHPQPLKKDYILRDACPAKTDQLREKVLDNV